ncbi:class I SAM-dependent methyltransferase [Actinoallomurus acanthiterrae]
MIIEECRICDNRTLLPVLSLGPQALTGVFPRRPDEVVPVVPLELVKCAPDGCGLVQLRHTADMRLMYAGTYGYRSGIRPYMVRHLRRKVEAMTRLVDLKPDDLVVDIGSNDGTLLRGYPPGGPTLVGVDPIAAQFRDLYPPHVELITDFFSRRVFAERYGARRARAVTSIAMFYDLPRPMDFMREVRDILADDGVWILEQSYLPSMLRNTAYDVICHEHLDYYALGQIEWMADRVGLAVIDAEVNDVYGGSLCVTLTRRTARHPANERRLARVRAAEAGLALDTMAPFEAFAQRVRDRREGLREFLDAARRAGRLTVGYGASTKGNVILQFCGLGPDDLPCIGEVNADKPGRFTPGTRIPIVSESAAKAHDPDQLLVLPWIHRQGFVERERSFVAGGESWSSPCRIWTSSGSRRRISRAISYSCLKFTVNGSCVRNDLATIARMEKTWLFRTRAGDSVRCRPAKRSWRAGSPSRGAT